MTVYRKRNPAGNPDALFAEGRGLEYLRQAIAKSRNPYLKIPRLFSIASDKLHMERIESQPPTRRQMEMLGKGLALLHQVPQTGFGFGEDNFIGLAPQPNGWSEDWGEFFVAKRLGFQVSLVGDAGIQAEFQSTLDQTQSKLIDFLNAHCRHPSLLHGDLWAGNVLFDATNVWLIDPAVYHGDREADIAMTEMFGGFSPPFYEAYDAHYPRTAAYPFKKIIYNLYHYLNHYNLFGAGYLAACRRGFVHIKKKLSR